MEQYSKRVNEFQITWQGRLVWVDVYEGGTYRVTMPDGTELRLWRSIEGWGGFPNLVAVEELGRLIDEREKEATEPKAS